jgi:hypothetical protein
MNLCSPVSGIDEHMLVPMNLKSPTIFHLLPIVTPPPHINAGVKLHSGGLPASLCESLTWTRESSSHCTLFFKPCLGVVYSWRHTPPLHCFTLHLTRLGICRLEHICLDAALCLIHFGTYLFHDVVAWYCLTVFWQPTTRVVCLTVCRLPWRSNHLVVCCFDGP